MNKDQESDLLRNLFLVDPRNSEDLELVSGPTQEDFGYSITARNPKDGTLWKHTIKTEEI